MKPAPGTLRIVANGPEGATTIVATVTETTLSMGTETYTWSAGFGMFVGDHVPATIEFDGNQAMGTIQGSTGAPPNQRAYSGTWVRQ